MRWFILVYMVRRSFDGNGTTQDFLDEVHCERFTTAEALMWKSAYLGRHYERATVLFHGEATDGDDTNRKLHDFEAIREVWNREGGTK